MPLRKLIVILSFLVAPFIFSCFGGRVVSIHDTIFMKNDMETKVLKALTKCTFLYTKTTKLSAVNFNVGCFEEGTNYVHVYIVVDESDSAASSADAASIIDAFFQLREKKAKFGQISSRVLKRGNKYIRIIVLRVGNVELDEILKYPRMENYENNL